MSKGNLGGLLAQGKRLFPLLDALNGYASGMPAPYYYQLLWQNMQKEDALVTVASKILVYVNDTIEIKEL